MYVYYVVTGIMLIGQFIYCPLCSNSSYILLLSCHKSLYYRSYWNFQSCLIFSPVLLNKDHSSVGDDGDLKG